MTAPGGAGPEQWDEVIELVGPTAWAFHQTLPVPQQVDLERSLRVRGTAARVAAAVLRTAAQALRMQPGTEGPQLKRVKDGAEELEYFAPSSTSQGNAELWEAQAKALEGPAAARRFANPAPTIEDWGLR